MATFSHNPFSENYWRILFRRNTWRQGEFALRRVWKDERARKFLAGFAGQLILIPAVLLGIAAVVAAVVLAGWAGGSPVFALLGLFIGFSVRGFRRTQRQEAVLEEAPQPLSDEQIREVHGFFSELAVIFAILAYRANSEAFLKQNVLPDHMQIISRQRHMELLRSRNLWEKLLPDERQVLMMPDGEWGWPLINEAGVMQEQLRLTRWILRLDFFLPDLGSVRRFDARRYKELIDAPERLAKNPRLVGASNLEAACGGARELHLRCFAEEVHRGYRTDAPEGVRDWARDICEQLGGKQSEDFLVGYKIVSDLTEQELRFMTALAGRRRQFLEWAEGILKGEETPTRDEARAAQAEAAAT